MRQHPGPHRPPLQGLPRRQGSRLPQPARNERETQLLDIGGMCSTMENRTAFPRSCCWSCCNSSRYVALGRLCSATPTTVDSRDLFLPCLVAVALDSSESLLESREEALSARKRRRRRRLTISMEGSAVAGAMASSPLPARSVAMAFLTIESSQSSSEASSPLSLGAPGDAGPISFFSVSGGPARMLRSSSDSESSSNDRAGRETGAAGRDGAGRTSAECAEDSHEGPSPRDDRAASAVASNIIGTRPYMRNTLGAAATVCTPADSAAPVSLASADSAVAASSSIADAGTPVL